MTDEFAPSRTNLGEQIAGHLRERIFSLEIEPGAVLNMVAIAADLSVSESSVRDALLYLVGQGLVLMAPGGYRVIDFDEKLLRDVFVVRRALEPVALVLAMKHLDSEWVEQQHYAWFRLSEDDPTAPDFLSSFLKADNDFHQALVQASGNLFLQDVLAKVIPLAAALRRWLAHPPTPEDVAATITEHSAILDAIRQSDEVRATEALTEHIQDALQRVLRRAKGDSV